MRRVCTDRDRCRVRPRNRLEGGLAITDNNDKGRPPAHPAVKRRRALLWISILYILGPAAIGYFGGGLSGGIVGLLGGLAAAALGTWATLGQEKREQSDGSP